MSRFRLIRRKFEANFGRIIFTILAFSISLFISQLIFSIGRNGIAEKKKWYADSSVRGYVYINGTDFRIDDFPIKKDKFSIAAGSASENYISIINDSIIEVPIFKYNSNYDILVPGDLLLIGSLPVSSSDLLVANSLLSYFDISLEQYEFVKLYDCYGKEYRISGVYDENGSKNQNLIFAVGDSKTPIHEYIVRFNDLKNVILFTDWLGKQNVSFESYSNDILKNEKMFQSSEAIILASAASVFVVSLIMLYCFTDSIIRDDFTFFAMLKSLGYTRTEMSFWIFYEIEIIMLFSIILSAVMYFGGTPLLKTVMAKNSVDNIFGIDVAQLMAIDMFSFLMIAIWAIIGSFVISMVFLFKIDKLQVMDILSEGY